MGTAIANISEPLTWSVRGVGLVTWGNTDNTGAELIGQEIASMKTFPRYARFRRRVFWGVFWPQVWRAWPGVIIGWIGGGIAIAALMLAAQVHFTIRSTSADMPPLEIVAEGGPPAIFNVISALIVAAAATVPALWLAWLDAKEKAPERLRDETRKTIDEVAKRGNNDAKVQTARQLLIQWPVEQDEEEIRPLLEQLLAVIDY